MNDVAGDVVVKFEPEEPVLETVTPKEFLIINSLPDDDGCEELAFFTDLDLQCTRKCLDNLRHIIKDFETQLDWHLQQYIILRRPISCNSKRGTDSSKQELTFSQLSALIESQPEGNKKFIQRKGAGKRKFATNRRNASDADSEEDCGDVEETSGAIPRSRKRIKVAEIKEEIVKEEHELIEPKDERLSDEEVGETATNIVEMEESQNSVVDVTPKKSIERKASKTAETEDLNAVKDCKVILNRFQDTPSNEVKREEIDKDAVVELLKKKAITTLRKLEVDKKKSTIVLNCDNFKYFDYKNCVSNNVFVKFQHIESLPNFIFDKNITRKILTNLIFLVQADVFSKYRK